MNRWKAILGVLLVFGLGLLAGGLVVGGLVARRAHRVAQTGALFSPAEITQHLGRRLQLDSSQREQVQVIVARAQRDLQAVRRELRPRTDAVLDDAITDVRRVLRPEQQVRFDKLLAEGRQKWETR